MVLEEIEPKKTCLMIIDMQNDFVTPGFPLYCEMGREMIKPLLKFADKCRDREIQVIYTRTPSWRRDKGATAASIKLSEKHRILFNEQVGEEIPDFMGIKESDIVLTKYKYSAFYGTNLDILLKFLDIDTMLITGVCTEACCFSTARDAGFREMKIAFLADLTGTIDYPDLGYGAMTAQEMHKATLCNIALTTAHVMSSDYALTLMK